MNAAIPESKGTCQRCGGHFSFSSEMEGQDTDCPHCGKQTTLLNAAPVRPTKTNKTNGRIYSSISILAIIAAAFLIPVAIHQHRISIAEEKNRAAAEARRQEAVDNMVSVIAALKVRTDGCTVAELHQCKMDVKTTYEVNKQQLAPFSTDIDQLIQLIGACELCWNNANINYEEGGTIYPKWPGQLEAMKIIYPNVTNQVDKPPFTTKYFNGKTFVRWGLAKISSQCDSLLSEMQPIRQAR
jgi:hypothetical protein